jgi:nucleoside-diphosphate kinase
MRTLILIKPDITASHRVGEVISAIEAVVASISQIRMFQPSLQMAREHYQEHKDKDFFNPLCEFLSSGKVVALIIEGDASIVTRIRNNLPVWRTRFGTDVRRNALHASDSPSNAEREITLWFS